MSKITRIAVYHNIVGYHVAVWRDYSRVEHNYPVKLQDVKRLEKVLSCYGVNGIKPTVKYDGLGILITYYVR